VAVLGGALGDDCAIVEFGPFRLDTGRRVLTRDGAPVTVSSRAFDVLRLLVENRDRVMSKDDLITHVWRGVVVEENNLAVQVSALRRALGEAELDSPLILTVPGQGYRFVGRIADPVRVEAAAPVAEDAPAAVAEPVAAPIPPAPPRPPRRWGFGLAAAAACLVIGVSAASFLFKSGGTKPVPGPPRLSIAVLPFRDLSDDGCCARFADAVSDDLTTDLSHIPGSVVIARESSDVYRGKTLPLADIGRALNVRYLLEGSLRAEEDSFSINAQLIEASTSAHLWAARFPVARGHLGQVQDAIVHRIASALGVTLIQIEGSTAARERASNPDALDLFFQARSILDRSDTLDQMTAAQQLLEQALVKQPDFADARGELAMLLARKLNGLSDPHFNADLARARALTTQQAAAAPDSGPAIAAQGLLLALDFKWAEARARLQAALEMDPESVPVRRALITCLSNLGLYTLELQNIDELLRIDPVGPGIKELLISRGIAYFMLNQPRAALAWLSQGVPKELTRSHGQLSYDEYGELFRIAALQQAGEAAAAHSAMEEYTSVFPYRSAAAIGNLFTAAQAAAPGAKMLVDALAAAGMRRFMDEHEDFHVSAINEAGEFGPFEPTPVSIAPPARVIDTAALRTRLAAKARPRIINVGSRAVTPDPALDRCHGLVYDDQDAVRACTDALGHDAADGPVVVMGLSVVDVNSYFAALALARTGLREVLWYRGGEDSWAASGAPYRDMRP
jgi:TolB-like protein/DNA-binding winged helix-turn-helix (wHTH) protein